MFPAAGSADSLLRAARPADQDVAQAEQSLQRVRQRAVASARRPVAAGRDAVPPVEANAVRFAQTPHRLRKIAVSADARDRCWIEGHDDFFER